MEQEDETRNPAWRTQENEPVLDIVRSPLNHTDKNREKRAMKII